MRHLLRARYINVLVVVYTNIVRDFGNTKKSVKYKKTPTAFYHTIIAIMEG
jgi:hypothetical protein